MTEREQIEEMAKAIFERRCALEGIDFVHASVNGAEQEDSHFMRIAKYLYANGYRKQTEGECKNERFIQYFNYYDRGCERTVLYINEYAKTNNLRIINISHYHTWGVCVLFEKAGE